MELFVRFATQGVYFQALVIAAGSLVVLRAPFQKNLSTEQIKAAPCWWRWLIRVDQPRFHRMGGWSIIGVSVVTIIAKLANGDG
jgi:hypothetical protein